MLKVLEEGWAMFAAVDSTLDKMGNNILVDSADQMDAAGIVDQQVALEIGAQMWVEEEEVPGNVFL